MGSIFLLAGQIDALPLFPELLGSKLLEKETALGKVEVSGFPREQWVSQAMKLWKQGENVYLSGQQEDGTHAQTKYFRREEYLPVNTIIELHG